MQTKEYNTTIIKYKYPTTVIVYPVILYYLIIYTYYEWCTVVYDVSKTASLRDNNMDD